MYGSTNTSYHNPGIISHIKITDPHLTRLFISTQHFNIYRSNIAVHLIRFDSSLQLALQIVENKTISQEIKVQIKASIKKVSDEYWGTSLRFCKIVRIQWSLTHFPFWVHWGGGGTELNLRHHLTWSLSGGRTIDPPRVVRQSCKSGASRPSRLPDTSKG